MMDDLLLITPGTEQTMQISSSFSALKKDNLE
jgi:hypothetical protein